MSRRRDRAARAAEKLTAPAGLSAARAEAVRLVVAAGVSAGVAGRAVDAVLTVLPRLTTPGTDPRETSSPPIVGDVSDPYAMDSVLVPVGTALLPHGWDVAQVDMRLAATQEIVRAYSLQIHSKVNGSPALVDHTYLLDLEGLAKLSAEFYALASRAGVIDQFVAYQHDALEALPI